jgi:hypothetical protein
LSEVVKLFFNFGPFQSVRGPKCRNALVRKCGKDDKGRVNNNPLFSEIKNGVPAVYHFAKDRNGPSSNIPIVSAEVGYGIIAIPITPFE